MLREKFYNSVSYTHLRAHETTLHLVCRLLLEKKKMRDPRLDELIQMETWDWWKAQVFYLREKKDYAGAEALFMEFKIPASDAND